MASPPKLTPEQRRSALEKAKRNRQVRASIKAQIKSGHLTLDSVLQLADSDEAIAKMRVVELLESLSGVGKIRALNIMERSGISPTRRIQGLGAHQVKALQKEFSLPKVKPSGKLLVLSGPGGVGKSTVAKELKKLNLFWLSISATTRSARSNEVDGVDYYFWSNDEFDQAIEKDLFLEWAEFAGARYGTPRSPVEDALAQGKNVLLEIEIAGARQIKKRHPEAILIFLEPPTWEDLVSRLVGRGTDSDERRAARLALAQEELAQAATFDHTIVNDEVEKVVQTLINFASA